MDFNLLLLFLLSSVALTLFPGPDITYVFSTSLTQGRISGLKLSLGLCSGLWIHTLLVLVGVGNLLAEFPQSQRVLEFLGGGYLLYLAYKSWSAGSVKPQNQEGLAVPKRNNPYLTGFIMNLTNPKVSLFFISFFPGFLFHQSWSHSLQFLILGAVFFIQALVVFGSVTLFAAFLGTKFIQTKDSILWNRIQALVLCLIALLFFYP